MLRALDRVGLQADPPISPQPTDNPPSLEHAARLRALRSRYRDQERFTRNALEELQDRLEHWHREHRFLPVHADQTGDRDQPTADRCDELQQACGELAAELSHVRLAITGTQAELHRCRERRLIGA